MTIRTAFNYQMELFRATSRKLLFIFEPLQPLHYITGISSREIGIRDPIFLEIITVPNLILSVNPHKSFIAILSAPFST